MPRILLECFELNSAYEGEIIGTHTQIASAMDCQALCAQESRCLAFNWHFTSEHATQNECTLRDKNWVLSNMAGVIAGKKACNGTKDIGHFIKT